MNSLAPHSQAFGAASPLRRAVLDGPEIVLDLSRLLSRVLHPTPTGVDRVEMAYARTLLQRAPDRVRLAATHPLGWHGRLPPQAAQDFLETTARRWSGEDHRGGSGWSRWKSALDASFRLAPLPYRSSPQAGRAIYLHLSSRGLERTELFQAILRRERARFVPFVHDLIPLDHPEYGRPGGAALYARKMATVTALASAVLVNSEATAERLGPYLHAAGRAIPLHVAPLAPTFTPLPAPPAAGPPYFVMVATLEPRKNHLLLLNVWRRMIETHGADAVPRLVLVGRRGWENENLLDMLDRCPALQAVVVERNGLVDRQVRDLIAGARALLLPSFAEGFGLPVIEALALGTPVIASDLPALHEAGGGVTEHLDPLDGPGWMRAVLDYAAPTSPRRDAQLARMRGWRAPTWRSRIDEVLDFLAALP
ncbi:glycosyltransferase family 4 protein [Caulobacter endophyticus]|uniref:glycosyltransferase family 4 protein n=1 Tax=Caulobacter endophyticus TaxID=2172652 RepID=UPI0024104C8E|nr:glycosyltransferase family 1 protein [Caulobacter endophyticus]MDG2527282.1 glycosyltransferase family 1 protein [Caulobacter endophyticus]